jgi:hypothetical protein
LFGFTSSSQSLDAVFDPIPDNKPDIHLELGSYYINNGAYGSLFGTYIAPHIGLQVGDRFHLQTGGTFSWSTVTEQAAEGLPTTAALPSNIYVSGSYLLNPKVIISGTVFKEFSLMSSNPVEKVHPRAFSYDREGFIIGATYRPSENMLIEARFGYSRGDSPYPSYPLSPIGNLNPALRLSPDPFSNFQINPSE